MQHPVFTALLNTFVGGVLYLEDLSEDVVPTYGRIAAIEAAMLRAAPLRITLAWNIEGVDIMTQRGRRPTDHWQECTRLYYEFNTNAEYPGAKQPKVSVMEDGRLSIVGTQPLLTVFLYPHNRISWQPPDSKITWLPNGPKAKYDAATQ